MTNNMMRKEWIKNSPMPFTPIKNHLS